MNWSKAGAKLRFDSADVFWVKPFRRTVHWVLVSVCGGALWLSTVVAADPVSAETAAEAYDTLTVGPTTYSNVVVQTKTKTDLFIKHSSGFANIKVRDIDRSTQLQLGYLIEEPETSDAGPLDFAPPEIEIDPRVEELTEQIIWESGELLAKVRPYLSPAILYGALAGAGLFYLLFCNLCRLICVKTLFPPGPVGLVWFPLLKQIPLLKAAGLSGWFVLLNLLPPLWPVLYVIWCFKIAKARGSSLLMGLLLLLPITNIVAFLYLAFSRGAREPIADPRRKNVITFDDQRRAA